MIKLPEHQEAINSGGESMQIGSYILGKTVGEGTFNKVKIARHVHSNEQVAVKLIDKSKITTTADSLRLSK